MIRTDRRMRICTTLTVLILTFIWGNSLMSAEASHALSEWVKTLLAPFLADNSVVVQEDNPIIRKLAHFTEFAALGACLVWRCGMLGRRPHRAFLAGFAAAAIDETIQLFVPERGPGILDVLLDSSGVLAGMLLLYLGHTLLKKRTKQITLEDTK